jgi:hypothetical protein
MQNPQAPLRHELVTWAEVDEIVDNLVPQIKAIGGFDGIVLITRGGIIPGGLLAEALGISYILTAAVRFADREFSAVSEVATPMKLSLPAFLQFPSDNLLRDRQLLLVDDVWGSGRTSISISGRIRAADAKVFTCVFHYDPYRSLFPDAKPDFYGAITDAYVIYPWEVDRGIDGIRQSEPQLF